MFKGRKLVIATKHEKEKVIAPILEKELGVKCFVTPDLDTDLLGTFTGEVGRKDDPIITARKKCLIAMELSNCDLSVASEGSFGQHPYLPFVPADDEFLLFIDKKNNVEIIARELSTETNFNGKQINTEEELNDNVLLLDCDTFYNDDIVAGYKSAPTKNTIFYFNSTDSNPIYSYINLDGITVTDIKEKIKISDNANTGAYGFESGKELKQYCTKVLSLDKEVYISCVYEEMLKDNKTIIGDKIDSFNCVGTPLQLKTYCNKYKEFAKPLNKNLITVKLLSFYK